MNMKLSTTKESSLLSASTTTTTMPQGPTGRVGELHSQAAARPDASASAWLCHKGPIARLVSHIRILQKQSFSELDPNRTIEQIVSWLGH
jgi:hypothetical protein